MTHDRERHRGRRKGASRRPDNEAKAAGSPSAREPTGKRRRPAAIAQRTKPGPEVDARRREDGSLWIYGLHAGVAAIENPRRTIKRILVAENALGWLDAAKAPADRRALIRRAGPHEFDRALHDGAVHQGLAVEVEDLARARLRDVCAPEGRLRPVVVLDQITDPHNIGAIFRSAAAFGARAIIVQERRTPPLAGALAKAASGAVEIVPCVAVVNVARALEGLKGIGYFCIGLSGDAAAALGEAPRDRPVALVLGAEGAGLRRLVAETCDRLCRIPIDRRMDSLNVSNAAAIALYEVSP